MTDLLERALQPSLKMENRSHELLGMETALLIATAASREIDVSVWFGEKSNDGKLPVREFDAKLTSLASAMGIDQDLETKRELDLAISTLALRMVHSVCGAGRDEYGQLLVDVSLFFKLCQEKVDRYLSEIDEHGEFGGHEDDEHVNKLSNPTNNFRQWKDGAYDLDGNLLPISNHDVPVDITSAEIKKQLATAEDYITDLRGKVADARPKSAPIGGKPNSRVEDGEQMLPPSKIISEQVSPTVKINFTNDMQWSEAKMTAYSPYDEEIEFPDEDHHDVDSDHDVEAVENRKTEPRITNGRDLTLQESGTIDWNAENRAFLQLTSNMPTKNEIINKPRPVSAPRMRRSEEAQSAIIRSRSADRDRREQQNTAPKRSDSPRRRNSFSGIISTSNRKGSSMSKLPLTEDQLNKLKEVVEDLVRDTVKKTDCYHLIQVNLGYIERYTMVPPRGAIVQSQHREWITNREIHGAFISGRLFLNDNHIKALKYLVVDFAKHYKVLYKEKADQMIKLNEELEEQLPGPVHGPNHTLNSEWLKKYLVHLRLTKRQPVTEAVAQSKALNTSSIGSKSATFEPLDLATKVSEEEIGKVDPTKTPICWKAWLGKKLKLEMERGPMKPKDLQKALNGQNHPLSKEDIEFLLKTHHILPQEALQQEIEYRIESWVLDTDGRRDFQHQLNVKIRTWIWDEMILTKVAKLPKDEHGYWRIWQSLSKDRRSEVKAAIVKKLVDEKREDLNSSERTKNEITRQLYWQFDAARREREIPWTEWLPSHLDKFRRNLDKFKKDEEERMKIANKQKQRRKSMASLQAIETNLKDVGKSLDSHHQMQLQKGIVSLRRAAQENGLGKGGIITKEEFDTHIKKILAPYIPLDDTFVENHAMNKDAEPTTANRFAEEWRKRITNLFTPDPKETIERVHEDQNKQTNRSKVSYQAWLMDKKKVMQEQEKKQLEQKEREEYEKEQRKKKSEKAFKKWLKLRNQNKYKSRVDNKYHPVPVIKQADHTGRWNYDKEFTHRDQDEVVQRVR